MKRGKHQRSKQRCQDLCWRVHNRAQSFLLRSYTIHELRNQNISILVSFSVSGKQLLCFVHDQGQKRDKSIQQRTLSSFITIPLY